MSRLTERFTHRGISGVKLKALDYKGNVASDDIVLEKLAELEDLMEKYHIDIKEMQKIFSYLNACFINTEQGLKDRFEKLEKDKKELAFKCGERYEKIWELTKENAELKKKLECAIVHKFKPMQKVWVLGDYQYIFDDVIDYVVIYDTEVCYSLIDTSVEVKEDRIFATYEEAKAKLDELKGERNDERI